MPKIPITTLGERSERLRPLYLVLTEAIDRKQAIYSGHMMCRCVNSRARQVSVPLSYLGWQELLCKDRFA